MELDHNKRVTIRDIAKMAGVSHPVVSAILGKSRTTASFSEATRARVEAVALEHGYSPDIFARSLRRNKSFLVGVLGYEVNLGLFSPLLKGMQSVLFSEGYAPLLLTHRTPAEEHDNLKRLMERKVDALIVNTSLVNRRIPEFGMYDELISKGFPILEILGRYISNVPGINIDFFTDAYNAANHLIERGHSEIALVIHDRYRLPSVESDAHFNAWEMFRGCEQCVRERGRKLRVLTHHIGETEFVSPKTWMNGGAMVAERILAEESTTGVICCNAYQAAGLLKRIREVDDKRLSELDVIAETMDETLRFLEPELSFNEMSVEEIGAAAARTTLDLISGKDVETLLFPGVLSMRGLQD